MHIYTLGPFLFKVEQVGFPTFKKLRLSRLSRQIKKADSLVCEMPKTLTNESREEEPLKAPREVTGGMTNNILLSSL